MDVTIAKLQNPEWSPPSELMDEMKLYSLIGDEGFARLVAAFYRRVPKDEILGPMYPAADLEGAERRLRDFLIYRFGGPKRYVSDRDHPRLRGRHFQFAITQGARDRWMMLMNDALGKAGLPVEAQQTLRAFFNAMSTVMINQDGRESSDTISTGYAAS